MVSDSFGDCRLDQGRVDQAGNRVLQIQQAILDGWMVPVGRRHSWVVMDEMGFDRPKIDAANLILQLTQTPIQIGVIAREKTRPLGNCWRWHASLAAGVNPAKSLTIIRGRQETEGRTGAGHSGFSRPAASDRAALLDYLMFRDLAIRKTDA
jgi:hypothetical protein